MTWRKIILHGNAALRTVALRRSAVAFLCLFTLQACEDALPGIGPRPDTFGKAQWQYVADSASDENADKISFVLIDVDRKITDYLATAEDKTYFVGTFTDRAPATDVLLGVGDTIRITIFEAGPGGLFVPAGGTVNGGNYITLPDQEVDKTGRISIPYADKDGDGGLVNVHGRRPAEVQRDIEKRLLNKAIEPQVIVTLVKRTSNLYSVIGDVNGPGRFSVDQGGVRILDALGAAGGPKNNDYNTFITLQRGTTSATARLSTLLTKPENNIFVQPNDLIAVKKDERYYNVLGATTNNNRIAFEAETVSVADALAKAGGLNPEVAEPAAVVVLRREDPKALEAMGVKLDGNTSTDATPTVYRFNLNEPAGLFLAQKMQLRNNDVVYVSNHSFSDASKVLGALRDVLLIQLIGK